MRCDYSSNLKLHYARVSFLLQLLLASQTIRSSTIYTLQTSGNGELDIYTTIYSHMQWTHIYWTCAAQKKSWKKNNKHLIATLTVVFSTCMKQKCTLQLHQGKPKKKKILTKIEAVSYWATILKQVYYNKLKSL